MVHQVNSEAIFGIVLTDLVGIMHPIQIHLIRSNSQCLSTMF